MLVDIVNLGCSLRLKAWTRIFPLLLKDLMSFLSGKVISRWQVVKLVFLISWCGSARDLSS